MSASSSTGWRTSCRRTAASTASGCASCANLGECTPSTTSASPCRSSSTASSSSTRRQFTQPAVQKSSSTIRPRSCSGPTSRPPVPSQRRPRSAGARTVTFPHGPPNAAAGCGVPRSPPFRSGVARTGRCRPEWAGEMQRVTISAPGRRNIERERQPSFARCRFRPFQPRPAGPDLARRLRRKRGNARERVNVARRRVSPAPPTSRATMRERRLSPTARRRRHEAGPTWCPLVGPVSPRQGAVSAGRVPSRTGPERSTPARRPGRTAGSTTRSPAPPTPTSPRSGTRRSR